MCFSDFGLYVNGEFIDSVKSFPSGVLAVILDVKLSIPVEPSFFTVFTKPFLSIDCDIAKRKFLFLNAGTLF